MSASSLSSVMSKGMPSSSCRVGVVVVSSLRRRATVTHTGFQSTVIREGSTPVAVLAASLAACANASRSGTLSGSPLYSSAIVKTPARERRGRGEWAVETRVARPTAVAIAVARPASHTQALPLAGPGAFLQALRRHVAQGLLRWRRAGRHGGVRTGASSPGSAFAVRSAVRARRSRRLMRRAQILHPVYTISPALAECTGGTVPVRARKANTVLCAGGGSRRGRVVPSTCTGRRTTPNTVVAHCARGASGRLRARISISRIAGTAFR
eukprot:3939737-Rhodomonas_salina.1